MYVYKYYSSAKFVYFNRLLFKSTFSFSAPSLYHGPAFLPSSFHSFPSTFLPFSLSIRFTFLYPFYPSFFPTPPIFPTSQFLLLPPSITPLFSCLSSFPCSPPYYSTSCFCPSPPLILPLLLSTRPFFPTPSYY